MTRNNNEKRSVLQEFRASPYYRGQTGSTPVLAHNARSKPPDLLATNRVSRVISTRQSTPSISQSKVRRHNAHSCRPTRRASRHLVDGKVHLASNSLASTQKFSSRTKSSNNHHARSKSRQNTDGIENRILHAPKSKELDQNRKKKIPKQKIKIDSPYKSKKLKNNYEAKPSLGGSCRKNTESSVPANSGEPKGSCKSRIHSVITAHMRLKEYLSRQSPQQVKTEFSSSHNAADYRDQISKEHGFTNKHKYSTGSLKGSSDRHQCFHRTSDLIFRDTKERCSRMKSIEHASSQECQTSAASLKSIMPESSEYTKEKYHTNPSSPNNNIAKVHGNASVFLVSSPYRLSNTQNEVAPQKHSAKPSLTLQVDQSDVARTCHGDSSAHVSVEPDLVNTQSVIASHMYAPNTTEMVSGISKLNLSPRSDRHRNLVSKRKFEPELQKDSTAVAAVSSHDKHDAEGWRKLLDTIVLSNPGEREPTNLMLESTTNKNILLDRLVTKTNYQSWQNLDNALITKLWKHISKEMKTPVLWAEEVGTDEAALHCLEFNLEETHHFEPIEPDCMLTKETVAGNYANLLRLNAGRIDTKSRHLLEAQRTEHQFAAGSVRVNIDKSSESTAASGGIPVELSTNMLDIKKDLQRCEIEWHSDSLQTADEIGEVHTITPTITQCVQLLETASAASPVTLTSLNNWGPPTLLNSPSHNKQCSAATISNINSVTPITTKNLSSNTRMTRGFQSKLVRSKSHCSGKSNFWFTGTNMNTVAKCQCTNINTLKVGDALTKCAYLKSPEVSSRSELLDWWKPEKFDLVSNCNTFKTASNVSRCKSADSVVCGKFWDHGKGIKGSMAKNKSYFTRNMLSERKRSPAKFYSTSKYFSMIAETFLDVKSSKIPYESWTTKV